MILPVCSLGRDKILLTPTRELDKLFVIALLIGVLLSALNEVLIFNKCKFSAITSSLKAYSHNNEPPSK